MRIATLCLALFIVGCTSAHNQTSATHPKLKVLVVTGGHGFTPELFFKLFKDNPSIDYTSATQGKSAEVYDRDDLFTYDVLVLYDAPQHITETQKARFLALFNKGTGIIVLHHALLSYQSWPEFERIAGAKYLLDVDRTTTPVTPESAYQGNAELDITVAAKKHPVTKGLSDFYYRDEIYRGVRMRPDITPLLIAENKPLAWTRKEKNSRVVGIIIGHGPSSYTNENFLKLLNQSIEWVGRRS